jgi:hypothetical protein
MVSSLSPTVQTAPASVLHKMAVAGLERPASAARTATIAIHSLHAVTLVGKPGKPCRKP